MNTENFCNNSSLLRNCFLDFAVEHWFGCRATEPGFGGEIGTIEVWLIDWLISIKNPTPAPVKIREGGLRSPPLEICLELWPEWMIFYSYWIEICDERTVSLDEIWYAPLTTDLHAMQYFFQGGIFKAVVKPCGALQLKHLPTVCCTTFSTNCWCMRCITQC